MIELTEEQEARVRYGNATQEALDYIKPLVADTEVEEVEDRIWEACKAAYKLGILEEREK